MGGRILPALGLACVVAAGWAAAAAAEDKDLNRDVKVAVEWALPPSNLSLTVNPAKVGAVQTMQGSAPVSLGACSGCKTKFTFTATNLKGSTSVDAFVQYGYAPPPPPRDDCFVPGTKILMEDGSYKNIEDVQAGDRVMSYDDKQGRFIGAAVMETTKNPSKKYYVVNGKLEVTPSHVIYADGEWKQVQDLKVGSYLTNANGEMVKVEKIEVVEEPVDVYNLVTDAPHDFFAENFLVHNVDVPGASEKDSGFAYGTRVSLIDGRLAPVETLKPGDRLYSSDVKNKRYAITTVQSVSRQTAKKTIVVNGKLRMALRQKFYWFKTPPSTARVAGTPHKVWK